MYYHRDEVTVLAVSSLLQSLRLKKQRSTEKFKCPSKYDKCRIVEIGYRERHKKGYGVAVYGEWPYLTHFLSEFAVVTFFNEMK